MSRQMSLELISPSEALGANSARKHFLFMYVSDMLSYIRILCESLLTMWACKITTLLVHPLSMVS